MKLSASAKRRKKLRRMAETRVRGPKVNAEQIDYKDIGFLQRMTSAQGKLFSRKRTGLDAVCQRKLCLAVKRARFIGLLPYVT